jgi:exoribonuclease R
MSTNQAKLLLELAKKLKAAPKKREQIVATLVSAKIITKNENLTAQYAASKRGSSTTGK